MSNDKQPWGFRPDRMDLHGYEWDAENQVMKFKMETDDAPPNQPYLPNHEDLINKANESRE